MESGKIGRTDLYQLPFFKCAIDSSFLKFDTESYLKYLNEGLNRDKDSLTKVLLEKSVKAYLKNITLSTLCVNLAKALQDCYVPGITESDDDPSLNQVFELSQTLYPQFHKECDPNSFESFNIGEHLYHVIKQLEHEKSNDVKIALCLGLYQLLKNCDKTPYKSYKKEVDEFPRYLQIKRLMIPDIKIAFDVTDILAVGILNDGDKYEFFQVTELIQPPEARKERFMTEKEYYDSYYTDDDEFDYPLFVYEKKLIDGEFDNYKLFESQEDYYSTEELIFLAVLKDNNWIVFQLSKFEEYDEETNRKSISVDVEEIEELSGRDIKLIETEINEIFDDL